MISFVFSVIFLPSTTLDRTLFIPWTSFWYLADRPPESGAVDHWTGREKHSTLEVQVENLEVDESMMTPARGPKSLFLT